MELLQCTAALLVGSGLWNSCNTPPHCLGPAGSATSAMYCHTARRRWAVELLQCAGPPARGQGVLPRRWLLPKERDFCSAVPRCLGAVGTGTSVVHCLTACVKWAVELLQGTASLPGGGRQWNLCNTLPHCLGAQGSATSAMHCHTALGQWAVELLEYTASLLGGSGQWESCNTLPHRLGAVGGATLAMHRFIAWGRWAVELLHRIATLPWGQWAVELLQCAGPPARGMGNPAQEAVAAKRADLLQRSATLPGRNGHWNSCHALPHCLGAVGGAILAIHSHTAWGQWAVELLQRTASLPGHRAAELMSCTGSPRVPGPVGTATAHCRSSTARCPRVVRQCIARVPLHTAPRQ